MSQLVFLSLIGIGFVGVAVTDSIEIWRRGRDKKVWFKKKETCRHDWVEVGDVFVEYGTGLGMIEREAVLYCPKCDKEQTMSFERASIELNKVKARKEYEGGDYFDPLY